MSNIINIFWFRHDLRISDNPGLSHAATNAQVLPIYILDDSIAGNNTMGSASKVWLYHSLNSLNKSLNGNLNLYTGNFLNILKNLVNQYRVAGVYNNRCYEPWRVKQDIEITATLKSLGIEYKSFNGSLLWEPCDILKSDQSPYKIYTYFYRNGCMKHSEPRTPIPKPPNLITIKDTNAALIQNLNLLPQSPWDDSLLSHWKIGENAAHEKLTDFIENKLLGYKENRNYPGKPNISKLSPHLHFGEISPNQIWDKAQSKSLSSLHYNDLDNFLSELGWREFSYYLLYHFPHLHEKNLQSKFDNFPWKHNQRFLEAWQKGQTGYPIVDAGMRELWQTGYMHNRVRMIVGSFLVKNLLIDWHYGKKWFWDCLVDADLANNSAGWQWIAGSGVDAAPYFRIFNPVTQGEKFDPDGKYTRHFVPELAKLPNTCLFKPWEATDTVLKNAGIVLGRDYPKPIVDLKISRIKALNAYKTIA